MNLFIYIYESDIKIVYMHNNNLFNDHYSNNMHNRPYNHGAIIYIFLVYHRLNTYRNIPYIPYIHICSA